LGDLFGLGRVPQDSPDGPEHHGNDLVVDRLVSACVAARDQGEQSGQVVAARNRIARPGGAALLAAAHLHIAYS
jgi:hypothetical protein